ncbi:MAG TPA: hypothetical protein VI685_05905 [Candidatus Angelobacter sp.]
MDTTAICRLAVMCLLGLGCAVAQDPTKVAPTHYRLAFENEHVQVVYVHYGPHEKSAMHDHPGGVVVNLTSGHLKFTDQDGKVREVAATRGEARWFPPFKHRVENLTDTSYDAVYIGIKGMAASSAASGMDGWSEEDREMVAAFLLALDRQAPQHSSAELPAPSQLSPAPAWP